jgi:exopolysaccharide biosynthesis protein
LISSRPFAIIFFLDKTKDKQKSCSKFQTVLLFIALQICFVIASDETTIYEPVDGACNKCNCTSSNGTLEDREHGRLFTLDCAMKNFQRLFTGWPGEAGDNSTGN